MQHIFSSSKGGCYLYCHADKHRGFGSFKAWYSVFGGGGVEGKGETDPRHNVTSQKLCDVSKAAVETTNVTKFLFKFIWKSLWNVQNKAYIKTLRKTSKICPLSRRYIRRITIITNQCWHPQGIFLRCQIQAIFLFTCYHTWASALCVAARVYRRGLFLLFRLWWHQRTLQRRLGLRSLLR